MSDDKVARGKALAEAVAARSGLPAAALARLADVTSQTYYQAVKGTASIKTYEALEAALAEWDEHPHDRVLPTHSKDQIEVEVVLPDGTKVTVRANDSEEAADTAGRVIAAQRGKVEPDDQ